MYDTVNCSNMFLSLVLLVVVVVVVVVEKCWTTWQLTMPWTQQTRQHNTTQHNRKQNLPLSAQRLTVAYLITTTLL